MTPQEQYWKERCEAAEELIRSSPDERDKLYAKWLESRTEPPAPAQGVEEAAKEYAKKFGIASSEEAAAEEAFIACYRWQQGQQSMSLRSAINAGSIENSGEGYIGDRIKKEMKGFYSFNHPARKTFDDVCWRLYGMTPDTLFENFRNNTSAFWLDIILPAMQEYADKSAPTIGARWVMGDYGRLYDIGKSGKSVPCYVDYDWSGDGQNIRRDIAALQPQTMHIGARGITYISTFEDEKFTQRQAFIIQCEQSNVEWLDESPCTCQYAIEILKELVATTEDVGEDIASLIYRAKRILK